MEIIYTILKLLTYVCLTGIVFFEVYIDIKNKKTKKNKIFRLIYSSIFGITFLVQFILGLVLDELKFTTISQIVLALFWGYMASQALSSLKNQQ